MPSLSTDLFDYHLPTSAIAQRPTVARSDSRLLVVDRARHAVSHHRFRDLPQFFAPNDILVRNNVAVLPARLTGRRPTGAKVECFLLRPAAGVHTWECLLKPGKKLTAGSIFVGESDAYRARVRDKREDGIAIVEFSDFHEASVAELAERIGAAPLPPYIERANLSENAQDKIRYQTVYADPTRRTAVAAPTAGLHFTPELFEELVAGGVRIGEVTLQVGLGTFRPIAAAQIEEHAIHQEAYEIPPETQEMVREGPGRRFAVGTTSVRTLEDFLRRDQPPRGTLFRAETSIFIYPPFSFLGADHLITNFHQPRSTLLCLVAAFLAPESLEGISWLREVYQEALREGYRFLSYGDSMLIL